MRDEGDAAIAAKASASISLKTLRADIGPAAMRSLFGRKWKSDIENVSALPKQKIPKIPRHEELAVGDVILVKGDPKKDIKKLQIQHGHSDEASEWTHAMLYVGNLHALESIAPCPKKLLGGVELTSLIQMPSDVYEMCVARHKGLFEIPERHNIARRALMDARLAPTIYGIRSAANSYFLRTDRLRDFCQRFLPGVLHNPNLERASTCSEFVLNHYVVGAQLLLEERDQLRKPDHRGFFFPARFAEHEEFDLFPLQFYKIET